MYTVTHVDYLLVKLGEEVATTCSLVGIELRLCLPSQSWLWTISPASLLLPAHLDPSSLVCGVG